MALGLNLTAGIAEKQGTTRDSSAPSKTSTSRAEHSRGCLWSPELRRKIRLGQFVCGFRTQGRTTEEAFGCIWMIFGLNIVRIVVRHFYLEKRDKDAGNLERLWDSGMLWD